MNLEDLQRICRRTDLSFVMHPDGQVALVGDNDERESTTGLSIDFDDLETFQQLMFKLSAPVTEPKTKGTNT